MQNNQILDVEALQRKALEDVEKWIQEDYHGRYQTLLVMGKQGDRHWESWYWKEGDVDDPMLFIDRMRLNGLDDKAIYRVIASIAKCVKRAIAVDGLKFDRH